MIRARPACQGPTRPGQVPAAPCADCGTVWGFVSPRCHRAARVHDRCLTCHEAARPRRARVRLATWTVVDGYEPSTYAIERGCALARLLAPRSPQGYGVVFRVHRTPDFLRPHLEIGP